jgi:gamma-glutamylcyclotransferase (GGCT)/AIG2-like uncharacterized protein YtfP
MAKTAERVVFVYGSLLRGEANHGRLAGARFVGPATTAPHYELVDLGEYPAMIVGGATAVIGELYAVDTNMLRRLDRFEGHPGSYRRCRILMADGAGAEAYLARADQVTDRRRVLSGDWRGDRGRKR